MGKTREFFENLGEIVGTFKLQEIGNGGGGKIFPKQLFRFLYFHMVIVLHNGEPEVFLENIIDIGF